MSAHYRMPSRSASFGCAILLALAVALVATGQERPARQGNGGYPPVIEAARVETYRRVGDTDLKVWIFAPPGKADRPLPAIVFFFGGGWTGGTPAQFVPQSRHLASRGMIAIVADYRVKSRQQARPADCVADAKACVRWLRSNAPRLGIDPGRIAAGGGSAGGHLAASVATLPGLDAADDDTTVSCVPGALVLFNPGVVMADYPGLVREGFGAGRGRIDFGCEPAEISPLHHVKPGLPPTLILHGKADSVVPYATVEKFAEVMKAAGNRCDLVGYEGQPHGFFNKAKYAETLAAMDEFLVSLGWLPAAPGGR